MALAYDYVGTIRGDLQTITNYIVATANDTTATVAGKAIDNRDSKVRRVNFGVVNTGGTGTSPTTTVKLQGSLDGGTTWYDVLDSGGNAITTGAVSAAATNSEFEDSNAEGIVAFPPLLRLFNTIGGSSTPGWTGTISFVLDRSNHITKQ